MNTLERATRRANLALLLSGLASLIGWCAVIFHIWTLPFTGPDLRNEFSMFLTPVFALGVALIFWGGLELNLARKKTRQ